MVKINVKQLSKEFKKNLVVDSVSFEVRRGQVFGILGPNGCGKSTVIRMMSGLLIPDSGKITFEIDAQELDVIKDLAQISPYINRVSVEASFFKKLSCKENLLYAGRIYGLGAEEIFKRVDEMRIALNFPTSKIEKSIEDLSRGLQQKIAIMRGFLSKPKVLFLDEPTTGLDPISKLDVQKFVKGYLTETGATAILTSHDMAEVEKLSNYILLMNEGKIVAKGNLKELKQKYGLNSLEEIFVNITGHTLEEENEIE